MSSFVDEVSHHYIKSSYETVESLSLAKADLICPKYNPGLRQSYVFQVNKNSHLEFHYVSRIQSVILKDKKNRNDQ